jgi:hypothetical protein
MKWAEFAARMGEETNAYNIFSRKHQEQIPVRRIRCSWKANNKIDHRETEYE